MDNYARRRQQILTQLAPGSALLLPAGRKVIHSADVHYPFHQDNDFWYLTGLDEPNAWLLLRPDADTPVVLWVAEHDEQHIRWEGAGIGVADAAAHYGVDAAYDVAQCWQQLPQLLKGVSELYYPLGEDLWRDQQLQYQLQQQRMAHIRAGLATVSVWHDPRWLIARMRLYKDAYELDCLRQAARISVAAHKRAWQQVRAGVYEYQIDATLLHESMMQGAVGHAYPAIVGGGENACILHYTRNHASLQAGDLLLIDAGCRYQHYCADITRTIAVSGEFSAEQAALYDIVLAAQQAGLAQIAPGKSWDAAQQAIVKVLTAGLVDVGILQGDVAELMANKAYEPFYMHQSGHWLGLDVHDVGTYKEKGKWRVLEKHMALTVEPGLYIPAGSATDQRWWGIGIRIEDDVVVNEQDHENLTGALPKTRADMAEVMRGG